MTDLDKIDESEALAGEYVLGLLTADERAAADARLQTDRGFAAEVAAWWDRLAPLLELLPDGRPSATLWQRIEAALDARPSAVAERPALAEPSPRRRPSEAPPRRRGSAGGLIASALAGAIAAGVATVFVMTPRGMPDVAAPPSTAGLLVASLAPESGEPLFVATVDPVRRTVVVTRTRVLPARDGSDQLWVIPADGTPRPAGLLAAATGALPLADELVGLATAGVTLAVSQEPSGGSPTGAPTGPVIATGPLVAVS